MLSRASQVCRPLSGGTPTSNLGEGSPLSSTSTFWPAPQCWTQGGVGTRAGYRGVSGLTERHKEGLRSKVRQIGTHQVTKALSRWAVQ